MCAGASSAASGLVNGRGGADHCRIEEFSPVSAAKRAQYAQDDTDTETCLCISCDATPAIDQDLLACVCVCVEEPAGSVVFLCEISIRNNFIAYCSPETAILSVASITAALSVKPPRAALHHNTRNKHTHTHTLRRCSSSLCQ
ncbi:hypothetical protein ROHU_035879 [Labeo rohita]|uniref:Uncharacterized protein n=1 Tax=Labeo rohita TaxID=84645 RepID=A0A498L200_LABRO|nr:hypothetical protein ROHU_035879 [Labeo rohita]